MSELISIIVPVYNSAEFLENTLNSLRVQTYQNIEVIIVDDGSKDNTPEIVKKFALMDKRFKVIRQENAGVSRARNVGLSMATGSVIGFVDGDDTCEPDQFEILYNALISNEAQVAICAISFEYPHRTFISGEGLLEKEIVMDKEQAIFEIFKGTAFSGHTPNKLFRREICEDISFDPEVAICEDTLFCVQAFLRSERVVFVGKALYHYFIRQSSSFHQKNLDKLYTSHISYEKIKDCFSSFGFSEKDVPTFLIAQLKIDVDLMVEFARQRKTDDPRYKILKETAKKQYKAGYCHMTTKQKLLLGMQVYCFGLYRLTLKAKAGLKSILRKTR